MKKIKNQFLVTTCGMFPSTRIFDTRDQMQKYAAKYVAGDFRVFRVTQFGEIGECTLSGALKR